MRRNIYDLAGRLAVYLSPAWVALLAYSISQPEYSRWQGIVVVVAVALLASCNLWMMHRITQMPVNAQVLCFDALPYAGLYEECVYFVASENGKRVKIGRSINPASRLKSLQSGSPSALRLVAVWPGGNSLERQLHERFATSRLHGEWFAMSAAIAMYIVSLQNALKESACNHDCA